MRSSPRRSHPNVVLEFALVVTLYVLYRLGRLLANGNVTQALANAHRVWHWERAAYLPREGSVQALILHSHHVERVTNWYYASVHFPAMIVFLLWMFVRYPGHYVWIRRALAVLTGAGLALHLTFPLAPPRMIPAFGLIDTGRAVGPTPYGKVDTHGLSNQFAAMPSLHVGWALVIAIGLIAAGRSRWRWLWLLHPAATLFAVVATANHYWLDAIVAVVLLAVTLCFIRPPAEAPADGTEADTAHGDARADQETVLRAAPQDG